MSDLDSKNEPHPEMDLARIERTLQASIKLMKRGRREMERVRRKSGRQDQGAHGQTPA